MVPIQSQPRNGYGREGQHHRLEVNGQPPPGIFVLKISDIDEIGYYLTTDDHRVMPQNTVDHEKEGSHQAQLPEQRR